LVAHADPRDLLRALRRLLLAEAALVDTGAGAVLADDALGGARRERGGEEEATQGSGAVHGAG
jgi:hypothetical protein